MNNPFNEFCDEKSLPTNLRKAFMAYCQSLFGQRYMMSDGGETVKLFMSRATEEQINEAWLLFIVDLKNTIILETPQDAPK